MRIPISHLKKLKTKLPCVKPSFQKENCGSLVDNFGFPVQLPLCVPCYDINGRIRLGALFFTDHSDIAGNGQWPCGQMRLTFVWGHQKPLKVWSVSSFAVEKWYWGLFAVGPGLRVERILPERDSNLDSRYLTCCATGAPYVPRSIPSRWKIFSDVHRVPFHTAFHYYISIILWYD